MRFATLAKAFLEALQKVFSPKEKHVCNAFCELSKYCVAKRRCKNRLRSALETNGPQRVVFSPHPPPVGSQKVAQMTNLVCYRCITAYK